jgi:hypothetical protein
MQSEGPASFAGNPKPNALSRTQVRHSATDVDKLGVSVFSRGISEAGNRKCMLIYRDRAVSK